MKKLVSIFLLSACSLVLSACQAVDESSSISHLGRSSSSAVDLSGYFHARLDAGRNHLVRHRLTQAVTAFRQASYDPALASEAFNGLGVAYARLGRADLARRYFGLAVSADPQDPRYRRNLARVDGASAAHRSVDSARSSVLDSPGLVQEAGRAETARATAPAGAAQAVLVRTSRYETRLTSRPQTGTIAGPRFAREFRVRSAGHRRTHVSDHHAAIAIAEQQAFAPRVRRERLSPAKGRP
jgi:tetratricopeptide (TPR) repeat protein